MVNKELWLQNNTSSDVSLSDLGVKIPANKTINIYKYNPYLTVEQVKRSQEDGSIAKRLKSETLIVVAGTKKLRPHTLDHIKVSDSVVEVVKSKSAVFIDTKGEDVLEDEDLGDFADYGFGELGHKNTINTRTSDGSIVVKQKQDDLKDEKPDAKVNLEVQSNISGQSIVAMAKQVEVQSDPVGPVAEGQSAQGQSYVVVRPPTSTESDNSIPQIQADAINQAEKRLEEMSRVKKSGDIVVIDGTIADTRDSDSIIKKESKTYDTQVATKNESGAIVMKLKEVSGESEETTAEAKPVKAAKPKKVKKKVKRTSKKTK